MSQSVRAAFSMTGTVVWLNLLSHWYAMPIAAICAGVTCYHILRALKEDDR